MFDKFKSLSENSNNVCIIFGAGASYGYTNQTTDYDLPPIVSKLFDIDEPIVKKVISRPEHASVFRLKDFIIDTLEDYNNDLEAYLSFLYKNNDEDHTFPSLLHYLHDVFLMASKNIDENNNYQMLIHQLSTIRGKKPWSCISFNYDTILEQSYILTGRNNSRKFNAFDNYLAINPKIIKIHGSVNFYYVLRENKSIPTKTKEDIFSIMMGNIPTIKGYSETATPEHNKPDFYKEEIIYNPGKNINEVISTYISPLMMIPIHGTKKHDNSFFKNTLEETKKEIASSDIVIAIGYNFGDDLFLNSIKDLDLSKKELILVGTENIVSKQTNHIAFQNISKIWKNENIKIFKGDGFSDFVESIIKKDKYKNQP